CARDAGFDVW
nr:immunoglobulin heavy chain junction region [Mus musculus]